MSEVIYESKSEGFEQLFRYKAQDVTPLLRIKFWQNDLNLDGNWIFTALKLEKGYYFCYREYKLAISKNKFYLKKIIEETAFFSYDGKQRRIISFKGAIIKYHIIKMYDWLNLFIKNDLISFISPSILHKIVIGKVTDPVKVCALYLTSIKSKASPKKLFNLLSSYSNMHKGRLYKLLNICTNQESMIDALLRQAPAATYNELEDMMMQALMLDKKINFNWRKKRLDATHLEWSRLIALEQSSNLSTKPIFDLKVSLNNMKLVNTEKDLFIEGHTMNNCIFSNYKNKVMQKSYIVFHYSNGEEISIGANYDNDKNKINSHTLQIRGPRNTYVKEEKQKEIIALLTEINLLDSPEKAFIEEPNPW